MAAKRKPAEKPLESLVALLPKMNAAELTEAALLVLEEGADRADTYAELLDDTDPPTDALNEGLVFVLRFRDVYNNFFADALRAQTAHRQLKDAEKHLQRGEPVSVNSG
jgi:hypothetical protein